MSIKYTYHTQVTETDSDHIKLKMVKDGHGSYVDDDIIIEAEAGPTPGSGYSITLMRNGGEDDYDIWFTINGTRNRVDVQEDGHAFYKYPPMTGIETIAVDADHYSTSPFSSASSWFRIKPVGASSWHNLSANEVYTLLGDSILQFGFGACLSFGTKITMADGTHKNIEDIVAGDKVLGYKGAIQTVDTVYQGEDTEYDEWYFEYCTITTAHRHRFYNCESKSFKYLDEWKIGEHTLDINGAAIELLGHTHYDALIKHATLFCQPNNTYYADGLLAGNRHSIINIKETNNE